MPASDARRPGTGLVERLRPLADAAGVVRFDRYMEAALYAEGVGYYDRAGPPPFGPQGDFYTAAHASPLFARTIARRIVAEHERMGRPRAFRIVELGPGDGTLAQGLIAALAPSVPAASAWSYRFVERSSSLRARVEERLASAEGTDRVDVRSSASLSADGTFAGVLLANELLDALPARRLVWRGGRWRDLGVRVGPDSLEWAEMGDAEPIPPPALPKGRREGAIVEVSPVAEALLREVGDHLVHGTAIFLDYGFPEDELIEGHPSGTLSAVFRHATLADPLDHPGMADLSAFVNFTRIRAAARAAGLREAAFRRQAEALVDWGFSSVLDEERARSEGDEAKVRLDLAAKNLLFGFENFRVLELTAGPSRPSEAKRTDEAPR